MMLPETQVGTHPNASIDVACLRGGAWRERSQAMASTAIELEQPGLPVDSGFDGSVWQIGSDHRFMIGVV